MLCAALTLLWLLLADLRWFLVIGSSLGLQLLTLASTELMRVMQKLNWLVMLITRAVQQLPELSLRFLAVSAP